MCGAVHHRKGWWLKLLYAPLEADNAVSWFRQSHRETLREQKWVKCPQASLFFCQLWANQIITFLSSKKNNTTRTHHSGYAARLRRLELWCVHQRCFQLWLIVCFPSVIPKNGVDIGWAVRSSLAITSCLVNKLSSKTVSCQELWSREELTARCSLDKKEKKKACFHSHGKRHRFRIEMRRPAWF